MDAFEPYAPLNDPKPFGEGLWIVDGPEIRMDYGPVTLPFPTRMIAVRLADGGLWLHSPIAPDAQVFAAIERLGPVRVLVAPNSLHYWYMADWLGRYPDARTWAVKGLEAHNKRPFRIDGLLEPGACPPWQEEIAWLVVPGTIVSEAVFYVRAADTVILTDLIENFEPRRVRNPLLRALTRLSGAAHPDGKTPIDLRLTFWPRRKEVARQVRRIVEWSPRRVVMAHGLPYEVDGTNELRRAFRWALEAGAG